MVSALWKACQDGDASRVDGLLADASTVDIEIKDHTGVTPLIQAVKGGHVHIVKALLAKGADPTNASAQGRPETYSTDPHILHVLAAARGEPVMSFPDPAHYYPYPYAQYPGYPDPAAAAAAAAGGWYPPPPLPPAAPQMSQTPQEGEHAANLPPPEVARNIPCRYYPACRYGSACVFAHPQAPYFPGPLPPPAQYGPPPGSAPPPGPQHYDHVMPPYPYYPLSPPFNPPPPPPHPHAHPHPHQHPASPPAPPGHIRTHSEVLSPPPFSPSHVTVPIPLAVPVQYLPPPISTPYPAPNPPVNHMSPTYPAHNPNHNHMYGRRASVTSLASYPSPIALDPSRGGLPVPKVGDGQQPTNGAPGPGGNANGNGNTRQRRGSAGFRGDRPQYGGRKPPCLFYPSGRCRNGDDCRFPHVIPEGGSPPPPQQARGSYPPRSRAAYYGSRESTTNGYSNLEEKLAGLNTRMPNANSTSSDTRSHDAAGSGSGGTSTPSRSTSKAHTRGHNHNHNRDHHSHQQTQPQTPAPQPQRVPGADEFPVLQANGHGPAAVNGHHSGPSGAGAGVGSGSNVNGHHTHANTNGWVNAVNGTGPTAAQLLREKDGVGGAGVGSSRGSSPHFGKELKSQASGTASTQNANSTGSASVAAAAAPAPAPENLASNSKPAVEVQVSA